MITVNSINIAELSDEQLGVWFNEMSDERKAETERVAVKEKRAAKIAADHLCRECIGNFCKADPKSIVFLKGEHGKPYAENLPVFFSVSHSGDFAVCAVSEREIGIDIEKIRLIKLKTAERFAAPSELEYITEEKRFFEIWTLKEAYFKCIGTGLGADIKSVSFEICDGKIKCSQGGFNCMFYNISEEYLCSVCEKAV
ncbi:MAG: 4'-phosphopantetheinyl transferase family protein [Acutalibacteraceae bacterium]